MSKLSSERPARVLQWAIDTYGSIAQDHHERAARFIEEAIELAQAEGVTIEMVKAIAERTYQRPPGDRRTEIGQAMLTLECLAENYMIDASEEATREYKRLLNHPIEDRRKRQEQKHKAGIALSSSERT